MIEQERSGHTFIVKGYHFLSTVKVSSMNNDYDSYKFQRYTAAVRSQCHAEYKINPLTVRPLHSREIPIFKASFAR